MIYGYIYIYCSGERALDNIDEDSLTASETLLMSVLREVIQTLI